MTKMRVAVKVSSAQNHSQGVPLPVTGAAADSAPSAPTALAAYAATALEREAMESIAALLPVEAEEVRGAMASIIALAVRVS